MFLVFLISLHPYYVGSRGADCHMGSYSERKSVLQIIAFRLKVRGPNEINNGSPMPRILIVWYLLITMRGEQNRNLF